MMFHFPSFDRKRDTFVHVHFDRVHLWKYTPPTHNPYIYVVKQKIFVLLFEFKLNRFYSNVWVRAIARVSTTFLFSAWEMNIKPD